MKTTAIYGLYDPRRPRTIRYVGKGLARRAKEHWKEFLRSGYTVNKRLLAWFKELQAAGVAPCWRFLETGLRNWVRREQFWIAYWRRRNPELCNVLDGGNTFQLKYKERVQISRIVGRINAEKKRGFCGRTPEQMTADGIKGGRENAENKTGFCAPGVWQKGWRAARKMKVGIFAPGTAVKAARKGAHVTNHVKRGIVHPACKLCRAV
jgi:hypothetical protein